MTDIQLERDGQVAVITLNRPAKLNAWTASMRSALTEHLDALREDAECRAVVFTGAGRAFCAGQDLEESAEFDPENPGEADAWIDGFEHLYRAVLDLDQVTISAVNGVAAGSGFQFALLSDLRLGDESARMGQPEVHSGIPSITGVWAMRGILGRARTAEFALTGELVEGTTAHGLGLLNRLVDPGTVLDEAVAQAQRLSRLPQGAVRLTKRHLRSIDEPSLREAFIAAKSVHREAYASGEPQREMRKFLSRHDKRT